MGGSGLDATLPSKWCSSIKCCPIDSIPESAVFVVDSGLKVQLASNASKLVRLLPLLKHWKAKKLVSLAQAVFLHVIGQAEVVITIGHWLHIKAASCVLACDWSS